MSYTLSSQWKLEHWHVAIGPEEQQCGGQTPQKQRNWTRSLNSGTDPQNCIGRERTFTSQNLIWNSILIKLLSACCKKHGRGKQEEGEDQGKCLQRTLKTHTVIYCVRAASPCCMSFILVCWIRKLALPINIRMLPHEKCILLWSIIVMLIPPYLSWSC